MPTTTERGRRGEQLACDHLRQTGYRIIELNHRIRQGEIDIVAEEGAVLCFIEVRTRRSVAHGHPLETIGWRKRRRIIRAAEHYLATHPAGDRPIRFDVVTIVYEPRLEIRLLRDAFDATRP